jgi:hypothetical protein
MSSSFISFLRFQGIWGSIVAWYVLLAIYSYVWAMGINFGSAMAGMIEILFQSTTFWFNCLLVPFVSITPDLIVKFYQTTVSDTRNERSNFKIQLSNFFRPNTFVWSQASKSTTIEMVSMEL